MKIGIDAQTILNPEMGEAAGLGHYTYQLIRYLLKIDSRNEYVLFFSCQVRKKDIEKLKKLKKPNVKIKYFPFSYYKKFLPGVYSELLTTAIFAREKLDILHVPGGRVPRSYKGKTVVTAYNLAVKKFPEFFSKKQVLKFRLKPPAFNKADAVIAVSDSARKDLEEEFKVDKNKIQIISNSFDEKFFRDATIGEIQKVKNKYGIEGEYLFFMNTIKPLNNLTRLIEVFAKLKVVLRTKRPRPHYKLVLAGKDGWLSHQIRQIAKDYGLKNHIIFTGYAPPKDLNALFGGADVFVFTPLYEEFGAPVLEAMACGTPVVCSNVSSLPEIAGDAALLVDPYDTNAAKEAILRILEDQKVREELKKKGKEQARKFHWEKTAMQTLNLYRKLNSK